MKLSISEILKLADEKKEAKDKVNVLRDNYSETLVSILRCAFDPSIKFLLPEGHVEFQKNNLFDLEHMLYLESRRLYLFVEGGHNGLNNDKRLKLFKNFLANIDEHDAELMQYVKDKKLPYSSIDKKLVRKAFPGLL